MLLDTPLDFANVILHLVCNSSLGVVSLHDVKLCLLSEKRTTILPFRGVAFIAVEIAGEFEITSDLSKWNTEGVAEVLPDPLSFRVEVLKHVPVVVLSV